MVAVHYIDEPATTAEIATEVYDVFARSGRDTDRLAEAMAALRALNPLLPADDSPVDPAIVPYVRLRRLPRSPWRLPSAPAAIRRDLEPLGVRNVAQIVRLSPRFLAQALPGHRPQDLVRYRNLARLMRIRGVDQVTAAVFHDHPVTPLRTPREVAAADLLTVRELLIGSRFPRELLLERPWQRISRHARMIGEPKRRRRSQLRPLLIGRRELAREAAFWLGRAHDPAADKGAAASAARIRWIRQVQGELVRGNEALAQRDGPSAYRHLRRVWSLAGAQALADRVIPAGSPHVDGPSVAVVIELCRRVIEDIRPADARRAVERLELEPADEGAGGVAGFRVGQLRRDAFERCEELLCREPIGRLGPGAFTAASRAFPDRLADGELPDLPASAWAEADPQAWLDVLESIDLGFLGEVRPLAGDAVRFLEPEVSENLSRSVDLADVEIGDRIVWHRPSAARELGTFGIPLNASFARRYRSDVLAPLLSHTGGAGWDFAPVDFADPLRFAFVLPQLLAHHLPLSLARSLDQLGRPQLAQAVRIGAVIRGSDLAEPRQVAPVAARQAAVLEPLEDAIGNGTTHADTLAVNCSDLDALYEQLHADNERGDSRYQIGDLDDATAAYLDVLETAGGCENLAGIVDALPSAHEALIAEAHAWLAGRSSTTIGLLDATISTPGGDIPIMTGVLREPAEPIRAVTDRVLGSSGVTFFTGGGIDLNIPEYESSDGGFDFDESDPEDEIEIVDLPVDIVFIPPGWGGGGGGNDPIPCPAGDPVTYVYNLNDLEREVVHAFSYLSQLLAGLNWLGLDPQTIPVWSFDHLLGQARYFAEKADGLQQRALSLLGAAELRVREEFQAAANAAVAAQGVAVSKSQEAMARANLEAAEAAEAAAEQAERHTSDDVFWAIGIGLVAVAAVVLAAPTGGASIAGAVVAGAALSATAAGSQGSAAAETAVSSAAQIDGAVEGHQQAASQLEVAQAQVSVAAEQVALAVEQTALAELESAVAAGYLDLIAGQALTANAYYELLDVISLLAGRYVLMANRLAWLGERAYERESRRYSSYVQMSYDQPDELVGRFTSGATLLSHLDALAHEQLTAVTERNQILSTTYSLLLNAPTALVMLQLTGVTQFRITQRQLDERFPGLYLHSLDRVEVEFDGLLPAGGVRAVLRTANQTSVRVPYETGLYFTGPGELTSDWCYPAAEFPLGDAQNPPRFAIKTLTGVGFTQVLSEYRRSRDGVLLRVPAGALHSFEHLGTDALWTLEIPRSGSPLDLRNITDVRVVLYFSAIYNADLAGRQTAALRTETVGRAAIFAATIHAADDFARLVAPPIDERLRDVRLLALDVADTDLPSNVTDRAFRNVSVFIPGVSGRALALRVGAAAAFGGAAVATSVGWADVPDGMAYSALGDNAVAIPDTPAAYRHREGDFPALDDLAGRLQAAGADVVGRWAIKVLPEDNPDWLRRDDDGLNVTVASGAIELTDQGAVSIPGAYLHAAVVTRLSLADGTATVRLREDVSAHIDVAGAVLTATLVFAGVQVRASAELDRLDEVYEVELAVHDRDAHLAVDGIVVAAATSVRPGQATSGDVAVSYLGPAAVEVADIRITRLRYDGRPLQELVRETFATADAVELSPAGATWVLREHHQLDLSSLDDLLVQLDYDARIDYLDDPGP